ncbi:MAG: hypothetical protein F6K26_24690 [Moorea sp. SIO2I5]|nr:hypothetical protein [Moorena sp. SIO2I5]
MRSLSICDRILLFDLLFNSPKALNPSATSRKTATSDAEVRPVANLIRLGQTHHYGLGGFPHSLLH